MAYMRTIALEADRSLLAPIIDQNTGRQPPFFFSGTPFNLAVTLQDNAAPISGLKAVHLEFKRPNSQQPHSIPSPDDPVLLRKSLLNSQSEEPITPIFFGPALPPFPSRTYQVNLPGILNPDLELGWQPGDQLRIIGYDASLTFESFTDQPSLSIPPNHGPVGPPLDHFAIVSLNLPGEFGDIFNSGPPVEVQKITQDQFHRNLLFAFTAEETSFCDSKIHLTLSAEHHDGSTQTYLAGFIDVRRDGTHGPVCQILPRLLFQQGAAIVGRNGQVLLIFADEQGVTTQLDLAAANGDMRRELYDPDRNGSVTLADAIKGISIAENEVYYGKNAHGEIGFHALPIVGEAGTGDMQKADYDPNNGGKVTNAQHSDLASRLACFVQTPASNHYYGNGSKASVARLKRTRFG